MIKGPKVLLDRNVVEKYFEEEDSEEERRKEAEKQRKRKKAAYYNRMTNKKWKTQSGRQSQPPSKYVPPSASASSVLEGKLINRRSQSPKKYKCDMCSKPFAYPGALKKHKLREHGVSRNNSYPMSRIEENGFDKEVILLDTDGEEDTGRLICSRKAFC